MENGDYVDKLAKHGWGLNLLVGRSGATTALTLLLGSVFTCDCNPIFPTGDERPVRSVCTSFNVCKEKSCVHIVRVSWLIKDIYFIHSCFL